MHIRFTMLLLLVALFSQSGLCQEPAWIDPIRRGSQYPSEKFLVSFKSEYYSKDEKIENKVDRMLKLAKSDLVEQIHVDISSKATLNLENLNSESLEEFRQASTSTSEAKLTGLKTATWTDKKRREVYAMAWINISDLIQASRTDLADKEMRVAQKIESAEKMASSGNLDKALTAYYECFPLIRAMESDIATIIALGREQVNTPTAPVEEKVLQGIAALRKGKELTLDQACYFLADGLRQQLGDRVKDETFTMGSFTYQDSRMGSDFSARLQSTLEQKLINAGFPVKEMVATVAGDPGTGGSKSPLMVSGTYWEEGDNLKLIVNLKELQRKTGVASVEEMLPMSWLNSAGVACKPDNYQAALDRQKAMARTDAPSAGLQVDVWTNRGGENPLFAKGDTMLIYMQANRPCFIRLVYYLADGQKTLLADNYEIREDKAGKVFAFPDPFVCDAPFGAEALQLAAQTEPFKPLNTKKENGYEFITDDVNGILANTRGMKNVNKQLLHAEKRVEVTTVER
jgi:hypothetical protein